MEILFSVLIGGGGGAVWAAMELGVFLWGQKRTEAKAAALLADGAADRLSAERQKNNYIMKYFVVKAVLDVLLLLTIFLLRDKLPFRWEYILIASGVVLALFIQLIFPKLVLRKK